MKYTSYDEQNPIRRVGSVNWLKYEIKTMTKEFNERYRASQEAGGVSPQMEERLKLHLDYGGKARKYSGDVLGYGFSGKRRNELERQYGALRATLKTDMWSPQAKEMLKDREQAAWESFNENQVVNWSYDKWRRMVDTFGNIDDSILRGFGYEQHSSHSGSGKSKSANKGEEIKGTPNPIESASTQGAISNATLMRVYSTAYDNGVDLFKILVQTMKELDKKAADPRDAIDALKANIQKASGKDKDIFAEEEEEKK